MKDCLNADFFARVTVAPHTFAGGSKVGHDDDD